MTDYRGAHWRGDLTTKFERADAPAADVLAQILAPTLVMVGEQAQEMQLAHWLPTTNVGWLDSVLPPWMGLWFAVFPTIETLGAQALAGALVLGCYFVARVRVTSRHATAAGAL